MMLDPHSSRVRRPSSTSDYILSGSLEPQGLYVLSPSSQSPSSSESIRSAPLGRRRPPRTNNEGGRESFVSLALPGDFSSSGGRSPSTSGSTPASSRPVSPLTSEQRKRYWVRKLTRMKDDLDRLGAGIKHVGSNIKGSLENLFHKMSPATSRRRGRRNVQTVKASLNCGVKVEVIRDSPTRNKRRLRWAVAAAAVAATAGHHQYQQQQQQQRQTNNTSPKESQGYETDSDSFGDHNFSMFLILTNLQDGMFCAELPMDKIPQGLVRIRVRDYRLEVTVVKNKESTTNQTDIQNNEISTVESAPSSTVAPNTSQASRIYCGSISIPIYVNPNSLDFELNDTGTLLLIKGRLKGCIGNQRMSLSTSDLRIAFPRTSHDPASYISDLTTSPRRSLASNASRRCSSSTSLHVNNRASISESGEEGTSSNLLVERPRTYRRGSSITRVNNSEFELEIEPCNLPSVVFPAIIPSHQMCSRSAKETDDILRRELQELASSQGRFQILVSSGESDGECSHNKYSSLVNCTGP